jgi:hypothetical protein
MMGKACCVPFFRGNAAGFYLKPESINGEAAQLLDKPSSPLAAYPVSLGSLYAKDWA